MTTTLLSDIWREWMNNFENHGLDPWYQKADRSTKLRNFTVESIWGILVPFAIITSFWIVWPIKVFKQRIKEILQKK